MSKQISEGIKKYAQMKNIDVEIISLSTADLIKEFNKGESIEAKLARDADQIALILDLKALSDVGYQSPKKWLPYALKRLHTEIGRNLAESIMATDWDEWWLDNYIDKPNPNN